MSVSIGGSNQTTTSSSGPSSFIQPYLTSALDVGEDLYQNQPLFRPEMNNYLQAGNEGMFNLANQNMQRNFGAENLDRAQMFASNVLSGHGLQNYGQDVQTALAFDPALSTYGGQLAQTARGDYLLGGPMHEAAQEQLRQTMPGLMSQYAMAGREGSGLAHTAAAREATKAFTMANQAERQNQLAAQQGLLGMQGQMAGQLAGQHLQGLGIQSGLAGMAPAMSAADYLAPQNMLQAGAFAEAHERNRQEEPWQRFSQWMQGYGPLLGMGGTSTTQNTEQPFDPLGAAVSGATLAGGLGWSPLG